MSKEQIAEILSEAVADAMIAEKMDDGRIAGVAARVQDTLGCQDDVAVSLTKMGLEALRKMF